MPTATDSPPTIARSLPAAPSRCTAQLALPKTIRPVQYSPLPSPRGNSAPQMASLPSSENPDNAAPAPAASRDSSTGAACIRESGPCPHYPCPQQSSEAPHLRGSAGPPPSPPATPPPLP